MLEPAPFPVSGDHQNRIFVVRQTEVTALKRPIGARLEKQRELLYIRRE